MGLLCLSCPVRKPAGPVPRQRCPRLLLRYLPLCAGAEVLIPDSTELPEFVLRR